MKSDNLFTRQFEVYEVDLSINDIDLGVCPCVIIQNDVGNLHSGTTIIMPLLDTKVEGTLCLKAYVKNIGEKYICASYTRQISKTRITKEESLSRIDNLETKKKIREYYNAILGYKSVIINGKKQLIDMTDEELKSFYENE